MFFGALFACLEELAPCLRIWSFVVVSVGGQGGEMDRTAALQSQLQVATVQQGIQTCHRDRQHNQRRD